VEHIWGPRTYEEIHESARKVVIASASMYSDYVDIEPSI
jgi:hypothetical protein